MEPPDAVVRTNLWQIFLFVDKVNKDSIYSESGEVVKFSKTTAKRLKIEETLKACSEDKRKGNQTKIKDSLMALQWIIQKVHYEEKHTDTKRKEHREPKKRPCTKNQLVSITRLVILSITLPF